MARKVVLALKSLQELGSVLRRRRRELGMDLADVQEHTKIRIRYLEALEAGDWGVLPGDVYARGFVRRYAEYVQLDGIDLLHTYVDHPQTLEDAAQAPGEPSPGKNRTESVVGSAGADKGNHSGTVESEMPAQTLDHNTAHEQREDRAPVAYPSGDWRQRSTRPDAPTRRPGPPRRQTPRVGRGLGGQAVVVIGILIVLGGGWWALSRHSSGTGTRQPSGNQPGIGSVNAPGATNNSTAGQTGNTLIGGGPPANTVTGNQSNSIGNSTGPGTSANTVTITAQPFQSSNPPTQPYVVQTTAPLSVTLSITSSPCWVSVTADGKVVDSSETLQPGQSKTWTGNQSIDIYLGHPPSASITVNGQAVTLPPQSNPYHAVFQKSGG